MTQEDKELLLKDLSARVPYGLKCSIYRVDDFGVGWRDAILNGVVRDDYGYGFYFDDYVYVDSINKVKPYLFPMFSMTEEQKTELMELMYKADTPFGAIFSENIDYFDWLDKNHFDYRGLIPKGLAEDATGKNIY